jgi:putative acetyltransferase
MGAFDIAETGLEAQDEILSLYARAFPAEDLSGLVADLLALAPESLSLVARSESGAGAETGQDTGARPVIGHVAFTTCRVESRNVALLGPLAVMPGRQKAGVGSALVRAGLDAMGARGMGQVLVLGDPAYYGRFGFRRETRIDAPYTLPADWGPAWQSLTLEAAQGGAWGRLQVPGPWRKAIYWAP